MKRGPYKENRKILYLKAVALREKGYGYRTIAELIGGEVTWPVVRNWVKNIYVDKDVSYQLSKSHQEKKNPRNTIDAWSTSKGRRKFLISVRGHQCESCGGTAWLEKQIPLELDHISGNRKDNSLENLRLLCPNCHAFTPTYKGKNISNEKKAARRK